jgi:hypothetical protein
MKVIVILGLVWATCMIMSVTTFIKIYNKNNILNKKVQDMLESKATTTETPIPRDYIRGELSRQKLFFDKEKKKWIKLRQIN